MCGMCVRYEGKLLENETDGIICRTKLTDYSKTWRLYTLECLHKFILKVKPSGRIMMPNADLVEYYYTLEKDLKKRKINMKQYEQEVISEDVEIERVAGLLQAREAELLQAEELELLEVQKQELRVYLMNGLPPAEFREALENAVKRLENEVYIYQ